ncbi:hypothetical protein PIB30_059158 [Stylosanthes scabra]|uniref:Uncharacterized protein n=1 Tax=Stylosanthes scabra TaxID=79078 RepID=A0ABU6ZIX5_9FABA|nr:hypothetical protein [Stylosanthes scabra]
MEEREKGRTTTLAKRKKNRRAVVMKREKDEVKDRERESRREGETWQRRGKRELSSPAPPLRAATTAEVFSVGAVPPRCPITITLSLLENRERERKNDGKKRTNLCCRCCQRSPCLRKPPFQAAILEPQPPP